MNCNRQNEMVPNNVPTVNDIDINNNINMYDQNQMMMMPGQQEMGMTTSPIIEPMRERVIQRTIVHEVPHVCPTRTRIINNHVYKHTYRQAHSCCSEDKVTNVQCGSCCDFR